MAVGKGSLLRAASAAGKGQKSSAKAVEKEVKSSAKAAEKEAKTGVKAAEKEVKNSAESDKGMLEMTEKSSVSDKKKSTGKNTRKKAAAKRTVSAQNAYLNMVAAECLQEIPQEWRGSKYVRTNVSMLAESVSRCGILEPLPVVQTGDQTYQLVGGSKRMQVVQMLGIAQVPVLVLPGSSAEDAKKLYQELHEVTEAEKKQQEAKPRPASLFGKQRIPEYLL